MLIEAPLQMVQLLLIIACDFYALLFLLGVLIFCPFLTSYLTEIVGG